ncbi:hypothetical protein [Stenotrophomonas bentonitica]
MSDIEKMAWELLAMTLGERGFHCEAENVRAGEDLESYEGELQAIAQLLRWGFNTPQGHARAALTPPEGFVLVPVEPTDAMQRAGAGVVCTDVEDIRQAWEAMLAARPEVSGG